MFHTLGAFAIVSNIVFLSLRSKMPTLHCTALHCFCGSLTTPTLLEMTADLLGSCCGYMEALATARPALFSAECRSLTRPVATVLQHAMPLHATTQESPAAAINTPDDGAGSVSGENEDAARVRIADGIEERKTLDLWVDMLGISLLPFCGGRDGSSTSSRRRRSQPQGPTEGGEADASDGDSDGDSSDEEDGGNSDADAHARSGWVGGWMRRAGVAGTEPPECPFDFSDGGADQGLPCRLAAFIASRAEVMLFLFSPSLVA